MNVVTVSPKYQVVIPREVRARMNLRPGEKLQVLCFDDRIELVPIRPQATLASPFLHAAGRGRVRPGLDLRG